MKTLEFRAFSAAKINEPLPGALPQAFIFRAFGAESRSHFAPLALRHAMYEFGLLDRPAIGTR